MVAVRDTAGQCGAAFAVDDIRAECPPPRGCFAIVHRCTARREEAARGRERAAVGCPGEDIAADPCHRHDGDGDMTAAIAVPANTASTLLTHFFSSGLSDDTYIVERFKAMVNGDIHRCSDGQECPAQE